MKMLKFVDGYYIEMTPEEVSALKKESIAVEPTVEERLAALESAMLEQLLGE